jgi:hypothetical protein
MGRWRNSRATNVVAVVVVLFVTLAGTAYAVDSFLRAIHVVGG